jgi:hypothetical protein
MADESPNPLIGGHFRQLSPAVSAKFRPSAQRAESVYAPEYRVMGIDARRSWSGGGPHAVPDSPGPVITDWT